MTTASPVRKAEHTTELWASPERAYRLVADVSWWPVLFSPCLDARVLESDSDTERIRLWALVGSQVRSWTSLRKFDAEGLCIDFRQETPARPVDWMSGSWTFAHPPHEGAPGRLVLHHEWSSAAQGAEARQVADALERNSTAELAAVRRWAELPQESGELLLSFSDRVLVRGDGRSVYEFLRRADLWPQRLAHVDAVDLETTHDEAGGGAEVQTLDMRTRAGDGSRHVTQSVRLCFQDERICYKQTTLPHGLLGHSGEWTLLPHVDGTLVTARHRVALDPAAVGELLGPDVEMDDAREAVRGALSGNSLSTLEGARAFVEGAPSRPEADAASAGERR